MTTSPAKLCVAVGILAFFTAVFLMAQVPEPPTPGVFAPVMRSTRWLGTFLSATNYRPVQIYEVVVVDGVQTTNAITTRTNFTVERIEMGLRSDNIMVWRIAP